MTTDMHDDLTGIQNKKVNFFWHGKNSPLKSVKWYQETGYHLSQLEYI